MKERYNKHEIAVIVLFVGILFAMLFGMAAPSVCRRLGISLPGTGKNRTGAGQDDRTGEFCGNLSLR